MEKIDSTGLYIVENNDFVRYNIPQGNVIVCGIPGAFTPGCTSRHLPGFANNLDKLKSLGVDKVVFVAVNDAFVMDAWNNIHGHADIDSVADPQAVSSNHISKDVDYGETMGTRCKRYAMQIQDGEFVKFFANPFAEDVLKELQ